MDKLPTLKLDPIKVETEKPRTKRDSIIKPVATARTRTLYRIINSDPQNGICKNLDERLNFLSKNEEYLSLNEEERTDFCQHMLMVIKQEIDELRPVKQKDNPQLNRPGPGIVITDEEIKIYNEYLKKRKKWLKWKEWWFGRARALAVFIVKEDVNLDKLSGHLDMINAPLEYALIWYIKHECSPKIIDRLSKIKLSPQFVNKYRGCLGKNWLRKAEKKLSSTQIERLFTKTGISKLEKRHKFVAKKIERRLKTLPTRPICVKRSKPTLPLIDTLIEMEVSKVPITPPLKTFSKVISDDAIGPYRGCTAIAGFTKIDLDSI